MSQATGFYSIPLLVWLAAVAPYGAAAIARAAGAPRGHQQALFGLSVLVIVSGLILWTLEAI